MEHVRCAIPPVGYAENAVCAVGGCTRPRWVVNECADNACSSYSGGELVATTVYMVGIKTANKRPCLWQRRPTERIHRASIRMASFPTHQRYSGPRKCTVLLGFRTIKNVHLVVLTTIESLGGTRPKVLHKLAPRDARFWYSEGPGSAS